MLFDYLTERFDPERRNAVEAEIKSDTENQKTLSDMKKAMGLY